MYSGDMITDRQGALLASIIENFIKTAEPVSSKFLEKSGFFDLSSATIRAEMCGLEELGYLTHLHTSGGRVPTDYAYRFYVDNLNHGNTEIHRNAELKTGERGKIKKAIHRAGNNPREINKVVAQTLSDLSENLVITGIEEERDFFKVGLSSLFEMPEFREFDRIFRMTSFFDEFENMFAELERAFFTLPADPRSAGGSGEARALAKEGEDFDNVPGNKSKGGEVKVFIGRENPIRNVRDETVMFAKYNLPHNLTGSLTLVGPTRMDYVKNIGLIKYTTNELNRLSQIT